jgi:DegV family protein with EDD domain
LADELGIVVVPVYLRFGEKEYRDRVDISEDEFYQRLIRDPSHPSTTQPPPHDFAEVYEKLSNDADGIVSIHLTSKLSGTYNSALQGKKMIGGKCPIEVIDTQTLTVAVGLIAVQAAKMAKDGKSLQQIVDGVNKMIPRMRVLVLFDTLKYLVKGGRVGKAKGLVGSILSIKPILTVKDGELAPSGQVRTRPRGIERLIDFVRGANEIGGLAVLYNTTPDEAQTIIEGASPVFPKEKILLGRLGPALGVHGGPGVLGVALWEKGP